MEGLWKVVRGGSGVFHSVDYEGKTCTFNRHLASTCTCMFDSFGITAESNNHVYLYMSIIMS